MFSVIEEEKTPATEEQMEKIRHLVADAMNGMLNNGKLNKASAKKLIRLGEYFQSDIRNSISERSDMHADEEVESNFGYPSGFKVKPIADQVKIWNLLLYANGDLAKHFQILPKDFQEKQLFDETLAQQTLPDGAEGWFVIPHWRLIASNYEDAFYKIIELLKKQRPMMWFDMEFSGKWPRVLLDNKRLNELMEQQKEFDMLLVPAQFGIRHRGRNYRRAEEIFEENEFALGQYEVACMLLTHPERLQSNKDLGILCRTNLISYSCKFSLFNDGKVGKIDLRICCYDFKMHQDYVYNRIGMATGFLPRK